MQWPQSVTYTVRKRAVSGSENGGEGEGEGEGGRSRVVTFGPIVADHSQVLAFGNLRHDLHRVASHERGLPLEVIVATSMSITNPTQLVAE